MSCQTTVCPLQLVLHHFAAVLSHADRFKQSLHENSHNCPCITCCYHGQIYQCESSHLCHLPQLVLHHFAVQLAMYMYDNRQIYKAGQCENSHMLQIFTEGAYLKMIRFSSSLPSPCTCDLLFAPKVKCQNTY